MTSRDAPPPLDELLARRDWVRRFARTLARDDASADDLAQDAWLAAVQRPPRPDAPAGWFRRVLVRRAMNRARSQQRRSHHEAAAFSGREVVSPSHVVATAESHRRVVDAVMALDEPYRETVLLRFFEDLPPREVAARMDVPVETVRARVRRAVEKLRARLDDEHGGNRAAWLAPLLRAGDDDRPKTTGATAGGGLAMATKWKTAAACLVLVVGGVAVWTSSASTAERTERAAAPTAVTSGEVAVLRGRPAARTRRGIDSPAAQEATPADQSGAAADADQPKTTLDVTVVDPSRVPVEGAPVRIDHAKDGSALQDATAVTDASGRAHFEVVGKIRSASVAFEGPDGRAWRPRGVKMLTPGETSAELVVEHAAWIAGRVVDEDGSAIPLVHVVALDRGRAVATTACDFEGRFKMIVPAVGAWDVAVYTPDPGDASTTVVVGGGAGGGPRAPTDLAGEVLGVAAGALDVVVTTRRAEARDRVLHVRAVAADGRPIANVAFSADGAVAPTRTDADGRVAIAGLSDRHVQVAVLRGGPRPWEQDGWVTPPGVLYARPGTGELTLTFDRGRAIRGRVALPEDFHPKLDEAGVPKPTTLMFSDPLTQRSWRASAAADGSFDALIPASVAGPITVAAIITDARNVRIVSLEDVRLDAGDVVIHAEK